MIGVSRDNFCPQTLPPGALSATLYTFCPPARAWHNGSYFNPLRYTVRGIRSAPWLADHVIFISYRWLAWLATGLALWWSGALAGYLPALILTGVVNLVSTLLAAPYVRLARQAPLTLGADIFYVLLLLGWTGGWASPFVAYAYGSLLLPGLLDGVRGWVMSSLSFITLAATLLWAADMPPAQALAEYGWQPLALLLVAPLALAFGLPWLIEMLRQLLARRVGDHAGSSLASLTAPPIEPALLRGAVLGRTAARSRDRLFEGGSPAVQVTRTRATEQSVEELRRAIFMPMPDADLSGALDLLAQRFGQHTSLPTRLALLGRTRMLNPLHRQLLVRLTQEALLNIEQHAHAATAMLTLRYDASSVVVMVQDDGVGLLDGTHERPGLHALRAMQYRLSEFGGRLDVFETEGGGVTVRASLPLE